MLLSAHARARLRERLPVDEALSIEQRLEQTLGEPGLVAIIVARLRGHRGDRRPETELRASNGDTVVAIVEDGTVVTVYYRRSGQPLPPQVERIVLWA